MQTAWFVHHSSAEGFRRIRCQSHLLYYNVFKVLVRILLYIMKLASYVRYRMLFSYIFCIYF